MSHDERLARRHSLGGSDANTIVNGRPEDIVRLWAEKRGEIEPRDLSSNLAVMIGSWTEELNRYWFEKQTGLEVTDDGQRITSDKHDWLTATLDGRTMTESGAPAIFEAKHVNAFGFDPDRIVRTYSPQLHHNMHVAGVEHSVLSVFVGTQRWVHFWVEFDPFFHADVFDVEKAFWRSVTDGTPPGIMPDVAPVILSKGEIVDMTGNNLWADAAIEYAETREPYKRNQTAAETLRTLVPKTATAASGHGISVKRDKRGSLRISLERRDDGMGQAAGA